LVTFIDLSNFNLSEFCAHYGTALLPTRPAMPRHKGKIESGVRFAQTNALKGRQFDSLAAQNAFLAEWERTVADTRIHGTIRQQVGTYFLQAERAAQKPLPASLFPCFAEAKRTVHRDGYVAFRQSHYSAPPEYFGSEVWSGYILTGGGAGTHWINNGQLLTTSAPRPDNARVADAKDHLVPETSFLTVYAIGIRLRNGAIMPEKRILKAGNFSSHPHAQVGVENDMQLPGGSASVYYAFGAGSLLTQSSPHTTIDGEITAWEGSAKDHIQSSPAMISGVCVGLEDVDVVVGGHAGILARWGGGLLRLGLGARRRPLDAGYDAANYSSARCATKNLEVAGVEINLGKSCNSLIFK